MRRFVLLALLLAVGFEAGAASRYLPRLRFRVLVTPHFRIYYHQGGEALARELAAIAESVHRDVPARLNLPAPGVTHVVIADQDDSSNGSALPLPYNTILLTAAWPAQSELIGFTRDWLRLVFVHEYTHILHTAQSRGWASVARAVFGRSPAAFPNLALPIWQIEGFATWVESRETREGRLRAGDAATIVRERVRQGGPEPIDRSNGGLVDWPTGYGPYLYGGFFHDYLVSRFGEHKLGELVERQAGRVHYFGAGAYEAVFGRSLGVLWRDFMESVGRAPAAADAADSSGPPDTGSAPSTASRLTHHGFLVGNPRFTPDGSAVLYTLQTPHRFPSIVRLDAEERTSREVTRQYGSEGISVGDAVVVFDQLEIESNAALRADLHWAPARGGAARRLTRNARLLQPALAPDGRSLVAVRIVGGHRELAWFDVRRSAQGDLSLEEHGGPRGGGQAGAPRWSPDGRRVVFERRIPEGPSEIVVVDPETGEVLVLASSDVSRLITPSWTPDGRHVVFAADGPPGSRSDPIARSFQLHAIPADGGSIRRLTAVPGGAVSPAISPDGHRLVFVGYTAEGADLFELPFDVAAGDAAWLQPISSTIRSRADTPTAKAVPRADPAIEDRAYSPLNTLLPRAWTPLADTEHDTLRVGAAAGGIDVLGRHTWWATVLWCVGPQDEAVNGSRRGRPDVSVAYTYDRWRTPLFVAASDETSFRTVRDGSGVRLPDAELRERSLAAGVLLPIVHVRSQQVWQAAFKYERRTLQVNRGEEPATFSRHAFEAGWRFDSARRFGYSISQEEGGSIGAATEQVRRAFGADGDAQAWTIQGRVFRRLGGRHGVLAARVGGAFSSGDANVRRLFFLGGAAGSGSVVNVGSEAVEMLRGLEDQAYAGTRVVSGSVEYRFTLARVERGWRTAPVFLRAVHAAVFADGGHAWDAAASFAWSDMKASAGAELSADAVIGFGLPVTLTAGVAWARDGAIGRRFDPQLYFRIGKSF